VIPGKPLVGRALAFGLHVLLPAFLGLQAAGPVRAIENLGTVGPTTEVAEPDLIEMIMVRLRSLEASGELARSQEAQQKRARERRWEHDPVLVTRAEH